MSISQSDSHQPALPRGAGGGAAIILSSVIAIAAISHHPSAGRTHDGAVLLARIVAARDGLHAVHAVAILAAGGLLFGFLVFSLRRGIRDDAVLAGLVSYAIGTGAIIGAALIDGFLVPGLGARYATGSPAQIAVAVQLLWACGSAIQVLTKLWLFASSLAVIAWSIGMLRGTALVRGLGIFGLAASVLVIGLGGFGGSISPHTFVAGIILGQTLWSVVVGTLMVRGEL
jgi:hypothetical protein